MMKRLTRDPNESLMKIEPWRPQQRFLCRPKNRSSVRFSDLVPDGLKRYGGFLEIKKLFTAAACANRSNSNDRSNSTKLSFSLMVLYRYRRRNETDRRWCNFWTATQWRGRKLFISRPMIRSRAFQRSRAYGGQKKTIPPKRSLVPIQDINLWNQHVIKRVNLSGF